MISVSFNGTKCLPSNLGKITHFNENKNHPQIIMKYVEYWVSAIISEKSHDSHGFLIFHMSYCCTFYVSYPPFFLR